MSRRIRRDDPEYETAMREAKQLFDEAIAKGAAKGRGRPAAPKPPVAPAEIATELDIDELDALAADAIGPDALAADGAAEIEVAEPKPESPAPARRRPGRRPADRG